MCLDGCTIGVVVPDVWPAPLPATTEWCKGRHCRHDARCVPTVYPVVYTTDTSR